jgi:hypothetical protein
MKNRLLRFLENDFAVAYALILIACAGIGAAWAKFEIIIAGGVAQ